MRFIIRDIFWLTIVVAVACGWYSNRRELAMRNRQLELHDIEAWTRVINAEEELEDYRWKLSKMTNKHAVGKDTSNDL